MKTTIFLIVALFLGKPGYSVLNDSTQNAEVVQLSEDVFELDYRPISDKVTILIKDDANRVVYRETVRKLVHFKRPYNISMLPEGDYHLEIRDGDTIVERMLTHELETRYSPIVRVQPMDSVSDRFKLTVVNPVNDAVRVRILDEIGRELYDNLLTSDADSQAIVRLFKLEKFAKGITIEVSTGNHFQVFTY